MSELKWISHTGERCPVPAGTKYWYKVSGRGDRIFPSLGGGTIDGGPGITAPKVVGESAELWDAITAYAIDPTSSATAVEVQKPADDKDVGPKGDVKPNTPQTIVKEAPANVIQSPLAALTPEQQRESRALSVTAPNANDRWQAGVRMGGDR